MDHVVLKDLMPGDAGWLVEQHALVYTQEEGFDASFEGLVAQIVGTFIQNHDSSCERGWIAWAGAQRVGCIFCVKDSDQVAKLRLFLTIPSARGTGLGQMLLSECMGWARARGYGAMRLWTHESHIAACVLYARNGWRCTQSQAVTAFGRPLVSQIWEVQL
ncbi:MAG: GNAT family N-acetyltransferase [Lutimaribacter sp.]|jgi:GNAT superfamily N-acetyltransferase